MTDYKQEIEEIVDELLMDITTQKPDVVTPFTTKLTHLIETEKKKELESIRAEAYSRASLERLAHAKGVIVDSNQVKWQIFEKRYRELQGEVGFRDGKSKPFGKAEDIVAEIRKGEVE